MKSCAILLGYVELLIVGQAYCTNISYLPAVTLLTSIVPKPIQSLKYFDPKVGLMQVLQFVQLLPLDEQAEQLVQLVSVDVFTLIAHEVQLINIPLDSTHCSQVVLGVTICLKESCVIILSVLQPGGYILGS